MERCGRRVAPSKEVWETLFCAFSIPPAGSPLATFCPFDGFGFPLALVNPSAQELHHHPLKILLVAVSPDFRGVGQFRPDNPGLRAETSHGKIILDMAP